MPDGGGCAGCTRFWEVLIFEIFVAGYKVFKKPNPAGFLVLLNYGFLGVFSMDKWVASSGDSE